MVTEGSHYARASRELRSQLARALPAETVHALTRRRPARHFLVAARTALLFVGGLVGAARLQPWYLWLPCAVVAGFCVLGFTILLHEVVHNTVSDDGSRLNPVLAWLYAFPSGLSRTQFGRWHLDHHAQLGDPLADPKRHHLSPKRNARWLKALYLTPALFFIYFRAAARETASYPAELRARVRRERLVTIGGQLTIATLIFVLGGAGAALKAYVVPYLFVFPVAFVINRLGQHYDIDPDDPGRWSTLIAPSFVADFAFLLVELSPRASLFPERALL